MVTAAFVGFATVADDSRHSGEFFAVIGVLLSGVAILASGLFPSLRSFLALQWTGASIAVGLAFGAILDRVALGLAAGIAIGLILAYVCRSRVPAGAEHST